jgi:putative inorganic carbon (HCO3(-)) transporter
VGIIKNISIQLINIEIFIVAGAIGVSMISTRFLPFVLAITAVFWIFRWLGYGFPSIRTPNDWAIGLLILIVLVTLFVTAQPVITHPQVYRLLLGIGFYFAIVNWTNSNNRFRFLIIALAITGIALALFGIFSVQWTTNKIPFMPDYIYDYLPTLVSDIIHRNVMAGTLVILIPIAIGLPLAAWQEFKIIENLIFITSALMMIGVLVLTQSRAGWMAFGVSMAALALMGGKFTRLLLLLGIFIGIIVIYFVGIPTFMEAVIASNTIGGIDGRIETWSRAIYLIQDFPFTGVGMGSFSIIIDTLHPFTLLGQGTVDHAHNLFLQIGVDLGLPGLISWFAILLITFTFSWQSYSKGKHSENKILLGLGMGFFCSQVALCSHGFLDAVTWGMVRQAPVIWGIWGLSIAAGLLNIFNNQNFKKNNSLAEV